jgi:predicted RNase H-like HicB family nuclease
MAAMSDRAYRVVVTREDSHWLADVPELQGAHTYARSLPTLDQAVREVIDTPIWTPIPRRSAMPARRRS